MNSGAVCILERRTTFLLGGNYYSSMELTPGNTNHPVLFRYELVFLLGPFHLLEYFLTSKKKKKVTRDRKNTSVGKGLRRNSSMFLYPAVFRNKGPDDL